MEKPVRQATLIEVIDRANKRILLAMKKRGFGVGKYNGYGGKVKEGESVESAAVRELNEESGLVVMPGDLIKVCEFDFYFPHKPEFNQTVHVFVVEKYSGEPVETEEMAYKWFGFDEVPYSQMWDDDKYWLERVVNGEKLKGYFQFKNVNGENVVDKQELGVVGAF